MSKTLMSLQQSAKIAFCALCLVAVTNQVTLAKPFKGNGVSLNKTIGIGISKSSLTLTSLKAKIRQQGNKQHLRLSRQEINRAAHRAINGLKANEKGPQKLIVLVSIRNFTICVSTGRDKDYCKQRRN